MDDIKINIIIEQEYVVLHQTNSDLSLKYAIKWITHLLE